MKRSEVNETLNSGRVGPTMINDMCLSYRMSQIFHLAPNDPATRGI